MKRIKITILVSILFAITAFPAFAASNSNGYIYRMYMDDWKFDEIRLSQETFTYDGQEKKPSVTIGQLQGNIFTNWLVDADYTLTYNNCVAVGQASVTATGNNDRFYSGSITAYYTIEPADISNESIYLEEIECEYDGQEKCPTLIAEGLAEGRDYEVHYSNNINAGEATASVIGIGNYRGAVELPFHINQFDISDYNVDLSEESYLYDGEEKRPSVYIANLLEGEDFETEYSNNTDEGTAYVTINGINNYKGTITKTFSIYKQDISEFEILLSGDSFEYDGEQKCPTVSIEGLKEGIDFEVAYSNNIRAGKATVTVIGIGKYTGSIDKHYYIWRDKYSLRVDGDQEQYYKEGEQVTVENKDDIEYKSFSRWEVVSGDLILSQDELTNNPITFAMPASDVSIRAIYSGKSLNEELAAENSRHNAVIARVSSLESYIEIYTDTANTIKNKYGVSSLQTASYYENEAAYTLDTLNKRRNYLAALRADTSGGHQVEIKRLEAEIEELNDEYQMYLELKEAAQFMDKAQDAQDALNDIDLNAEARTHENNIAEICEKHGVANSSVAEIEFIHLDKYEYDYTGKEIHPAVIIVDTEGKKLGTESYDVIYPSDCISVGSHVITINLKGNYAGIKQRTFTIVKNTSSDTPSDTPSDTSSDTPSDTPSDTSSDTPSDTPQDTPSDTPEPTVDPVDQKGSDGTALGKGASVQAAEAAIAGMTSDNDLPGSVFNKLQLKSSKQTDTYISITWKKVSGAKTYVIYGNKCGKTNKMQRLAASTGKSKNFSKVLGKKLKKGTYYKFMIIALDRNNNVVSSSKIIHVATKGGKVGNVGKVTTKAKKNKVSIKKGKTFKLVGKQTPAIKKLKVKKHRAVTYESSDPEIATVSKKGVIKGKKKGTCYVYAYAQNGVFAKIKVTIK